MEKTHKKINLPDWAYGAIMVGTLALLVASLFWGFHWAIFVGYACGAIPYLIYIIQYLPWQIILRILFADAIVLYISNDFSPFFSEIPHLTPEQITSFQSPLFGALFNLGFLVILISYYQLQIKHPIPKV